MSQRILRHLPFVIALAATLWVVWIGVLIWKTPIVIEGITAQSIEGGAEQSQKRFREVRSFSDMSPLGYLPLAIPVILAAGAALIAWFRAPGCLAAVVVLFLGYVFITGFSIGGAYHGPAAVLAGAVLADIALSWKERRQMAEA
jgi:hypothetical protein